MTMITKLIKIGFGVAIFATAALSPNTGRADQVTVSAVSGPWNPSINPNLDYGIHDQTIGTPILVQAGQTITFSGATGVVCADSGQACTGPDGYTDPNGPFAQWVPANDKFGSSGTLLPSFYMSEDWDVFLMELVGAFTSDTGTVLGNPFKIGTATITVIVPPSATHLQLGVVDDIYGDNHGSIVVDVSISKNLRVFLNWDPAENTVPRKYNSTSGIFTLFLPVWSPAGPDDGWHTYTVDPGLRAGIQSRVTDIYANVPVEFTDSADGSVTVNFLEAHSDVALEGNASDVDRFNDSAADKWADIFIAPQEAIEEIATTIAHEIGHTAGLRHVGSGIEVMAPVYDDNDQETHEFINSVRQIADPFTASDHNPVYHLRRWINGDSDEELRNQFIFPGSWDIEATLNNVLLKLGFGSSGARRTSSDPLYDVNIFLNQGGDASTLLMHFDEIDLDGLSALDFSLPFGASLNIFASSMNDGRANDVAVALSGDPFDPVNLAVPVTSGQQSAMLQLQTGPDTFETLSDVTVTGVVIEAPITAVSRRQHGSLGQFDVPLPLTGEPGLECRDGGGNYTIVATFPNNLVSGSAAVISGTGTVLGDPSFVSNTMTVNLTGVADVQTLTMSLSQVTDELSQVYADTSISMNILIGDVTADKVVGKRDFSGVKHQAGHPITVANFRDDIDSNGVIDRADGMAVRLRKGHSLP